MLVRTFCNGPWSGLGIVMTENKRLRDVTKLHIVLPGSGISGEVSLSILPWPIGETIMSPLADQLQDDAYNRVHIDWRR